MRRGRELMGVSMSPPSLPDSGLDPIRIAHTPAVAVALERALSGGNLSREEAALVIDCPNEDVAAVCAAARVLRDRGKGRTVTFSPKVFIPLTRLCRDVCGYCTFRTDPRSDPHLRSEERRVGKAAWTRFGK